jgi:hypothetical protein
MTYPAFIPPALPPQALPKNFIGQTLRSVAPTVIAGKPLDAWHRVMSRCPEARADKMEFWLRKRFDLSHDAARLVIAKTDAAKREMPTDFVRAVFGAADIAARRALENVKRVFDPSSPMQLVPTDEGLMLKGKIVFCVLRPAATGLVMTTTKVIATEPERLTTTRVDHLTTDALPEDLIADLRAGAALT